ncbi:exocyst complex component EXO70C1-like [Nicotiana tabacum]|uniref:Exocyst subunit Exo70 family protein n=1 Tax=Nicotiana tabacum TaxID=4097 RepID=A0A1S4B750_TOBAC|nr:PREDICTED: exocyst complex component EXO70B1-like [Nicotiana tabacum]
MVKNHLDKNGSFTGSPKPPRSATSTEASRADQHSRNSSQEELDHSLNTHIEDAKKLSEDIDRFVESLSMCHDKSNPPEVPDSVDTFSKIVESRIKKYNSCENATRFCKMAEEDTCFIEAVTMLSKLTNSLSEFPSGSMTTRSLNLTSMVLQRAMTFMEEELRNLLEDSRVSSNSRILKNSSFNATNLLDGEQCDLTLSESSGEEEYPSYSPDVLTRMNRIASAMILAGYETECCQVYSISRRNAFSEQMKKLEFERINMEDVQRMPWDSLEGEITRWIRVVKSCSTTLFPGEKRLGDSVFSDSPMISRSLFSNLARAIVIQLLDFAEAVSMTKRSAEKLFKYLDMYEAIRDLIPTINESCSNECENELKSEISATGDRIGESAVSIFCDLENSIKNDVARTPVPGGAVHPLTRYVMNYLKYACEYKGTLEHIFQQHVKLEESNSPAKLKPTLEVETENESPHGSETVAGTTPFSIQLVTIMDLLDTNLEAKSNLYRDPALRHIFLMNNGRYILQKVKGSAEIHQVMGDTWCRRRSTIVRQYHKNYQRETWGKVLQILSHDGMQVHGKVVKTTVKERFKNFNTMFDEIHRSQSTWVVSDEQLQSELRVSISALVIPAYRSFFGRFRQYLDNGKQAEKYVKYQPEDIETLIDELFDGNSASMARRKT